VSTGRVDTSRRRHLDLPKTTTRRPALRRQELELDRFPREDAGNQNDALLGLDDAIPAATYRPNTAPQTSMNCHAA
jgi:hypothetical protein